ncbi:hypothetical protein D3C83_236380 [compost metagenome]
MALIQLDEGPLVYSNLVDASSDEIAIGMRVQAVFEEAGEGFVLPRFRRTPRFAS